ncbi:GlxA family transcriptional regulator [Actinoplanes sp. CA-054009]
MTYHEAYAVHAPRADVRSDPFRRSRSGSPRAGRPEGEVEPRRVVVVGYDGAELLDIACVTTALRMAGELGAARPYRVSLVTLDGGPVCATGGLLVQAHGALRRVGGVDTLVVTGGHGHELAAQSAELVAQVRRVAGVASRVASVCTGATVLAATGLLDGRRATTHWHYAAELARRFPAVTVDPAPIFVRDGKFATSGGVTASLDLMLAFIEEDHGPELARRVATATVAYLQRPGDQTQMSVFTRAPRGDALVRSVIEQVLAHPDADLRADALAADVGVSPRQLNRLFREHLDESPAAAVRRIRLELAARLITTTDLQLAQIARRCGFRSAETLRQAFSAHYGVSPRAYRHATAAGHIPDVPAGTEVPEVRRTG